MTLPKWSVYGPSKNNRGNALMFEVDGRELYFSYKTLVAFRGRDGQLRISKNYWGVTTGKHLNAIDPDHAVRLTDDQFQAEWLAETASPFSDLNHDLESGTHSAA